MRTVFIRFLKSFWENYLLPQTTAPFLISFHLGELKIEVRAALILKARGKKKSCSPTSQAAMGADISRADCGSLPAAILSVKSGKAQTKSCSQHVAALAHNPADTFHSSRAIGKLRRQVYRLHSFKGSKQECSAIWSFITYFDNSCYMLTGLTGER